MLRLPAFRYLRPQTAAEAAHLAAEHGQDAMFVAGGTDLFPNLKRRQFEPKVVIGLSHLPELAGIDGDRIGAGVPLAVANRELLARHPGYAEAAGLVSSPPLRAAGTIGGNLCVDTRCNYYNMTHEWREAAGFCMKKDGVICLVAPSSRRCWAVSSSDTAPMAIAMGATVELIGPDGPREIPAAALYNDDGMAYLAKRPDEVLVALRLPKPDGTGTAYAKVRRRGSIDFPVAGAAVALRMEGDTVTSCSIVLSAAGSHPVVAEEAGRWLAGRQLTPETRAEAAALGAKPARPLDNTDLAHHWRKRMFRTAIEQALERAATRTGL